MNFQKGNPRCRRIDLLIFFVLTQSVAAMIAELCRGSCCCRSGCSLAIYRPWQALPSPFWQVARWFIQQTTGLGFPDSFWCFSRIKKLLGWTETQMSVDTNSLRHILRQWVNDLNYPARSRSRHRSTVTVRLQKIVFPDHNIPWDSQNSQISVSIVPPGLEKLSKCVRLTGNPWNFTRLVCVCVCLYPPFFRHDLTATKFGTHVRIDPGIIRTQNNLTHPTPGGGGLGVQISKVL